MEEKKMKTVPVEVFGYELWLQPTDGDNEDEYDCISRYSHDGMIFTVDENEYTLEDFSEADEILSPEQLEEYKDIDVDEFFKESGAQRGILYFNKAWSTINIEIPEDEEFDPKKAAVVIQMYDNFYADYDPFTICAFAYDGKAYSCHPEDSVGKGSEEIWNIEDCEDEEDDY